MHSEDLVPSIEADLALIQRIGSVPLILRILCDATGLGFAALGRVGGSTWTACAVLDRIGFGLHVGSQLDLTTTLCHKVTAFAAPIVIDQASTDPIYRDHPTPKLYGFESYIAVPVLRRDGSVFGTICGLDPAAFALSTSQVLPTLELFAQLLTMQIDAEERLDRSRSALGRATELAGLRDRFVAVLGHDLRNPIAALSSGLELLGRHSTDQKIGMITQRMKSSVRRMTELVDNVLDFARGELGDGIPIVVRPCESLAMTLLQVVDELQSIHPQRVIVTEFDLRIAVECDSARIAQILSNLLANALTHGDHARPVRVRAASHDDRFILSVENEGEPVSAEVMAGLFRPFSLSGSENRSAGLGLGLYIASEIARSHGGMLRVTSDRQATIFTLEIPARA
ncbi:ATP-binding protein [Lichenicoccus sp.]|uniref:GAF domain-containing sensor histidine kinase n=1 Tax=Lichenicoccus sp. TaxID=2781899 RepID=UPI003D10CF7E